ncbi:MAG: SDR family oxidoreductase [Pirellulales bacterium]|nr:SDR family oxidoreductase [Pirellulales bacterium]
MSMLDGKVCLVTGAGQGLGQATCKVLSEAGATVVAADIRGEAAQRTAQLLERPGGRAVTLDVSQDRQAAQVIDEIVADLGGIDVLVNNAGVDKTVPVEELSFEDWDRIMAVNLRGPFVMSKLALRQMKSQGGGHIVNIVSTAAKRAWANAAAYHASKWGLLGLSHALHVEGRPHKVKVTAVIAGGMRTPFLLDRFPDLDPNVLQDPKNVADTVRFVLTQPAETVVPEVMVLPMRESSWP